MGMPNHIKFIAVFFSILIGGVLNIEYNIYSKL